MVIIKRVNIRNFKIFSDKTFAFDEGKFILITGANGFGKTTLIDAIEWCLTGHIKRIETSYVARNSAKSEKINKENFSGIIKNKTCTKDDEVRVTLTLSIDGKDINVYRKQKEEDLLVSTQLEFEDKATYEDKALIRKFADDSFYNYHICDMQKTYRFLDTSRTDMKNRFSDFIKDRQSITNLRDNLNLVLEVYKNESEKNNKKIEDINKEITNINESITKLTEKINKVAYPIDKLYINEDFNESSIDLKTLTDLKKKIESCGILESKRLLSILLQNLEDKRKYKYYEAIWTVYKADKEEFTDFLKNKYDDIINQNKMKSKITEYDILIDQLSVNNIIEIDSDKLNNKIKNFDLNMWSKEKKSILNLKQELDDFNKKIDVLEKGNSIIKALSDLVNNREGFQKYQNLNSKCPLCGSNDKFSSLEVQEIAYEAEIYLNKTNQEIIKMKEIKKDISLQINRKSEIFYTEIKKLLEKERSILSEKMKSISNYYEKNKEIFKIIKNLNISLEMINDAYFENELKLLDEEIIKEDEMKKIMESINNILLIMNYPLISDLQEENVQRALKQINAYTIQNINILPFDFDLFNKKMISIDMILKNLELSTLSENLNVKNKLLLELKDKNGKIDEKKSKIRTKISDIQKNIKIVEQEELSYVGNYLFGIYSKIIKHTNITRIDFKRDNTKDGKASFIDQSGNNLLNILSEGQLGVFMISMFFGNAIRLKNEIDFKTYFVDDITNCMDDMNILSFIDFIRYQFSMKDSPFQQFFFSTCNHKLEDLLIHKMDSFDIKWQVIHFDSYESGTITRKSEQKNVLF